MNNAWWGNLINTRGDGTAVANSTAEASLLPSYAKYILDAGYFVQEGIEIDILAEGRLSNIVATPGTLTLRLKFGSIAVWDSGAIALNTTAKTNLPWKLSGCLRSVTVGSGTSATLGYFLEFKSECIVGSVAPASGGSGSLLLPAGATAAGSGFDSSVAQTVDLTAQFSVANAGNTITCHKFRGVSTN